MLVIPVHGTTNLSIPNTPKIVVTSSDSELAVLPKLRMLVDPLTLSDTGSGTDRVSVIPLTGMGAIAKVAASRLGGKPAMRVAGNQAYIRSPAGTQRGSQTVIMAINPSSFTNNRILLPSTMAMVRNNNNIAVSINGAGQKVETAAGWELQKSFIVGYSIDETTRELMVFAVKEGGVLSEKKGVQDTVNTDAQARNITFEMPNADTGMAGDYGRLAIFDTALHLTDRPTLDAAIAAFRKYYSI